MKYSVSVNEKKRTVTVTLGNYKGVAKCCPTDNFCLSTGIELALERAKVAKENAENAKKTAQKTAPVNPTASQMSVPMLAKQLEKTLPLGNIVVAVGGGDKYLTDKGRKWLAELAGKYACNCGKECLSEEEIEEVYDDGFTDGKEEGREEALDYVRTHIGELVASWVEELAEAVDECLGEAAENMAD